MDNCTAITCDGKTVEWARSEKTRDRITVSASGKFPDMPTAIEYPESSDLAKAATAYARLVSSKIQDSATLCLPTSDVIFRVSRLPSTDTAEIAAMSRNQMEKDAPLPIEEMTASFEVLSQTGDSSLVLSACSPTSSIDNLSAVVGIPPSRIDRIEATILATLRNLNDKNVFSPTARDVALIDEGPNIVLVIADAGMPVMIRSSGMVKTANAATLTNAARVALIQAQLEHGQMELSQLVCAASSRNLQNAGLSMASALGIKYSPVAPASLPPTPHGAAVRTIEGTAPLNLFPEVWKTELDERKFGKRMRVGIAAAAALLLLLAGWLYVWPAVMDQRIKALNTQVERRAAQESEVNDLRNRIKIIENYSDRTFSAMEVLLAATLNLPEGVEMTSFRYNGDKNHVSIEGKSKITTLVYDFMEGLNTSELFGEVKLVSGPTLNKALNIFVFELGIDFKTDDAEEGANPI